MNTTSHYGRGAGWAILLVCLWTLGACNAESERQARLELVPLFDGLSFDRPVAMLQAPAGPDDWYVVQQAGQVHRLAREGQAYSRRLFADIGDRVISGGEKGLLGMTFHPGYPANRQVYLSYTGECPGGGLCSYVSRFLADQATGSLDEASEVRLLQVVQPHANHNGGQIAFGPDGLFYIGLGDGGGAGDPHGHGQNTRTLLGAMLRVDVDGGHPYAIPPDNPFADGIQGRPELYAWGLRNPWRWSFDRQTGEMWLADVGQNDWEEIDRIVKGGNYGWNIREGRHCFRAATCDARGLIDPVAEYDHGQGFSVTGGYVYRGAALPGLQGVYVYGDFGSGRIWGYHPDGRVEVLIGNSGLSISSFAEDRAGELHVLDYARGGVWRLALGGG